MADIYPQGPHAVPPQLTRPTPTYKQKAWLAMASLALFMVIYLALAGWFAWTAYRLLKEGMAGGNVFGNFLVGGGAAFLALFMLKALVFLKRGGTPDAVEVTAAEQPRLFEFLHRLADEAGAPRPARVFLSGQVNAAVFYDLSVLNLLFPSRKNLEIGLPLVNVLTVSEVKAVLAHEFGHFAQRSMAIGSWVYIAQQIASHVVEKRDALDKFLRFLSNVDVRVAWFGWLLSLIVWSIRSLMDTLLRVVVLAQRALSRQMEFQADLVAVSLTGSDELIHALHKLHAADDGWQRALGFARVEAQQGRLPHDLFAVQTRITEHLARILNDQEYGRTPARPGTDPAEHRVFKSGFAQPPQMWATHPANADREANAKRVYLDAPHDARSAWLLFDDGEAVKRAVTARLTGNTEAKPVSAEETLRAVDERYLRPQYESRYRGAYVGRALTRYAARPDELYETTLRRPDVQQTLAALYPPGLSGALSRLQDLGEERVALEALRDRVYQPTGGRIVHRGREIPRRGLPAAIREVAGEEKELRDRIFSHDRQCRRAHLEAAGQLGNGWREYLLGLIRTLHYAEHTLADVVDAQGLLGNVVAVVTADGKVSSRELKRLLAAANMLHGVVARVHQQKSAVRLDQNLCQRLEMATWAEALGEFELPQATEKNINDWMGVIDGWVNSVAGPLSALVAATLEQLLVTEDQVARSLREQRVPEPAPAPGQLPEDYPTLLPGKERERQRKLGLWDRFQTADGLLAGTARLIVAGAIVVAVLGFGGSTGTRTVISLYNGLGSPVEVMVDGNDYRVAPFSAYQAEVELGEESRITTLAPDGTEIEHFTPTVEGRARHYVYNVASAAPLVEWTAVYGNATERQPIRLGAPRWFASDADVFFAEPPESVKTKGGGATRQVLDGLGDADPVKALAFAVNDDERARIIAAHAQWDGERAPYTAQWRDLAAQPLVGAGTEEQGETRE